MNFRNIVKKYNDINLVVRILAGILLGIALAASLPQVQYIGILGDLFVGALKAIAPLLVLILVISSIAQSKEKPDGRFRTVIFFYLFSTFISAAVAVCASYLFPQTLIFSGTETAYSAPASLGEVVHNLLINIVVNPISSLTEGNYLGILFWAIITGIALKSVASDTTKVLLSDASQCISKVVTLIIEFAPFGIMGLVYSAVSSNGIDIFTVYGKMILLLAGCMFFVYFVSNPIIVFCAIKKNPYPLILKCFKESGITAFFTRSSAANIPMNMALCERLGLDKDLYSISIPLGATINMNGAAITISVMTLAAVSTLGISVSIFSALLLSILSTFAACGASGVAGGSLLLIPLACSLFGIPNDIAIQVVGVGFIIGVIQDSLETALNSSGDAIFSATAEYYQMLRHGKEIPEFKN
ncbi:serine/threonine transporter SstT [bacterium]|nr:serine/threonine transporter SstT [bacterium]